MSCHVPVVLVFSALIDIVGLTFFTSVSGFDFMLADRLSFQYYCVV